ncbi:MAG: UpxY family transcription antiterminator [Bacteroidaceae bacterium]|nr:UpxY family transcription antiterminator [Bacteroidaceae bacterium]
MSTRQHNPATTTVEDDCTPVWFAMSAPYRRELRAKEFLDCRGIECFVPMKETLVERPGGTKSRRMVPAVHNIIFVHTTKERIRELKQGVNFLQYHTRPVAGKNVPIIVPDRQMQQFIAVTKAANEDITYLRPEELDIAKGTKVRVHGGVFDGTEGYFVKLRGKRSRRVVMLIEGITAVALTEISTDFIEVIG